MRATRTCNLANVRLFSPVNTLHGWKSAKRKNLFGEMLFTPFLRNKNNGNGPVENFPRGEFRRGDAAEYELS